MTAAGADDTSTAAALSRARALLREAGAETPDRVPLLHFLYATPLPFTFGDLRSLVALCSWIEGDDDDESEVAESE